ncbi:hypothetical protein F5B20DRAFT_566243 [Whalleya microplaca]|nr:hypothetical protein F5B20DRAFT_566243 [Whalleya microplaca]
MLFRTKTPTCVHNRFIRIGFSSSFELHFGRWETAKLYTRKGREMQKVYHVPCPSTVAVYCNRFATIVATTIFNSERSEVTRSSSVAMCRFWAMKFLACECPTHRSSGYEYCPRRGKCTVVFKQFEWLTFCPASRKALKGGKYDDNVPLPKCCADAEMSQLESLCLKCNSTPSKDTEHRSYCSEHIVLKSVSTDIDAEAEFEKAVALWPVDMRARYFRRKKDKKAVGSWSQG